MTNEYWKFIGPTDFLKRNQTSKFVWDLLYGRAENSAYIDENRNQEISSENFTYAHIGIYLFILQILDSRLIEEKRRRPLVLVTHKEKGKEAISPWCS